MLRVFIQARMSSKRFPGKVLAPFKSRPMIEHVIERASRAFSPASLLVLTSSDPSDDPLEAYLRRAGVATFRGPLDNVFGRFQLCLRDHPCSWFVRLCADSPLLDPAILRSVADRRTDGEFDLITNVHPRTFPKGHSVEVVRSETFSRMERRLLSSAQQEHPMKAYYDNPSEFRILNVNSRDSSLSSLNYCVDTPEDLSRLEALDGDSVLSPPWILERGATQK